MTTKTETMKDTLENKAKFFALYLNQRQSVYRKGFILRDNINPNGVDEFDILELTPLSQITDEDVVEVANLQFPVQPTFKKLDEDLILRDTADYLRSKGYALPWLYTTVEQQVEFGWIKLKKIQP